MRDLSLLTDFYQLTMAQGYAEKGKTENAVFDLFYREIPVVMVMLFLPV